MTDVNMYCGYVLRIFKMICVYLFLHQTSSILINL